MARLKDRYNDEIRDALVAKFGYSTPMQAPRLVKVTLNMGVGEAKQDSKMLDAALGQLADTAYQAWAATQPTAAAQLHHAPLRHPTYPESASRAGNKTLAETTAILLADWNEHLPALRDHVMPDGMSQDTLYGTGWQDGDLVRIPHADLPPGSPDWWFDLAAWASRTGPDVQTKRATISVVVPRKARLWPVLPTPTPPSPEG